MTKRQDKPRSKANLKGDASAKGDRVEPLIPDPKALDRATKILGDKPKRSTFSKNVEKMLRALKKGEKS